MWNVPNQRRLEQIPRLYETEGIPLPDKVIHLHLFIGSCDWYIAEFDGAEIFWGHAILNGDFEMAEWGYIGFDELLDLSIGGIEVDCELEVHFPPRKASEIDRICQGMGWPVPGEEVSHAEAH